MGLEHVNLIRLKLALILLLLIVLNLYLVLRVVFLKANSISFTQEKRTREESKRISFLSENKNDPILIYYTNRT